MDVYGEPLVDPNERLTQEQCVMLAYVVGGGLIITIVIMYYLF